MNTINCVREFRDSSKKTHETYRRIEEALKDHCLCFDDVAFFNYIFRPVWECAGGYSNSCFNIDKHDRTVSAEIMRWFICEHDPTHIVIASSVVARWTCVEVILRDYKCLSRVVTHHPIARNSHFKKGLSRVLREDDQRGEMVFEPEELRRKGHRISQEECNREFTAY